MFLLRLPGKKYMTWKIPIYPYALKDIVETVPLDDFPEICEIRRTGNEKLTFHSCPEHELCIEWID